jgi:hypothetical protein
MNGKPMLRYLGICFLGLVLAAASIQGAQGQTEKIRKSTAPQVHEGTLTEGRNVKQWKPGDPVRVTEDLRENTQADRSGERISKEPTVGPPAVRKPVAPQVMEKNLKGFCKQKGYKPGEPVRVVPDLKEDGGKKEQ